MPRSTRFTQAEASNVALWPSMLTFEIVTVVADVSKSRLTHRLRILIKRGDVMIAADSDDQRGKHATLTPTGRQRLETLAPLHVANVRRLIFDQIDSDETEALAHALSKVAATLCDHEVFQPDRGPEPRSG